MQKICLKMKSYFFSYSVIEKLSDIYIKKGYKVSNNIIYQKGKMISGILTIKKYTLLKLIGMCESITVNYIVKGNFIELDCKNSEVSGKIIAMLIAMLFSWLILPLLLLATVLIGVERQRELEENFWNNVFRIAAGINKKE